MVKIERLAEKMKKKQAEETGGGCADIFKLCAKTPTAQTEPKRRPHEESSPLSTAQERAPGPRAQCTGPSVFPHSAPLTSLYGLCHR